jgi:hypothetical protein
MGNADRNWRIENPKPLSSIPLYYDPNTATSCIAQQLQISLQEAPREWRVLGQEEQQICNWKRQALAPEKGSKQMNVTIFSGSDKEQTVFKCDY